MELKHLTDNIYYIEHTEAPFSADSFIIMDKDNAYIYDVGANPGFVPILNNIAQRKTIILSHFHEDHTKNSLLVLYDKLYLSSETHKHVHDGTLVDKDIILDENTRIGLIPTSHTKNAVYLLYKGYLFVGDGIYASKKGYNVTKLNELITMLKNLDFTYMIISHEDVVLKKKESVLSYLLEIYSKRDKNKPYIEVEE